MVQNRFVQNIRKLSQYLIDWNYNMLPKKSNGRIEMFIESQRIQAFIKAG
jgi:hypothetical protein